MSSLKQEQQKIFNYESKGRKSWHQKGWAYDRVYLMNVHSALMPEPDDILLDVGCGVGQNVYYLEPYVKYVVGVDLSMDSLRKAKAQVNANYLLADAEFLPFKSQIFQKMICSHIIEHIPDQYKVLFEMKRVLSEGGLAYVLTPNRESLSERIVTLKEKLFAANERKRIGHINLLSLSGFIRLIKSIKGLSIVSLSTSGIFWPGGLPFPGVGRIMSLAPLIILLDKLLPKCAEKMVLAEQKIASKTFIKIGWDIKVVLKKKS